MKKSGIFIKTRNETGERLYENGELRHEAQMYGPILTSEEQQKVNEIFNWYMDHLDEIFNNE